MKPFVYERASNLESAIAGLAENPDAVVLAGGTELVNWLKEGILTPSVLVDIGRIPGLAAVASDDAGLHIGALARMSDVAAHPVVRGDYPAIALALVRSASAQLRNMATMGGNLLQRTRCPYFRADTLLPCNKRVPGSGCAARGGHDRFAALFGSSEHCIATHPSDVAVAFAALDASVRIRGAVGDRAVGLDELYLLPGEHPEHETTLVPGDLIVGIDVPRRALAARSYYLKIRERASYEFALVSAAVAVDVDGTVVADARIALGGVAPRPWRLRGGEEALRGRPFTIRAIRDAVENAFTEARPGRENRFKIELAKRAIVRAMREIGAAA